MQKKTKWMIAGGIIAAFAYAASLWSQYPENQQQLEDLGVKMGLREPSPEAQGPASFFIVAGAQLDDDVIAMPAMSANSCVEAINNRLVYEMTIIDDSRENALLTNPLINGNSTKYQAQRRAAIADVMEREWNNAVHNEHLSDLTQPEAAEVMREWLNEAAAALLQEEGLSVSIRVNKQTGVVQQGACQTPVNVPARLR